MAACIQNVPRVLAWPWFSTTHVRETQIKYSTIKQSPDSESGLLNISTTLNIRTSSLVRGEVRNMELCWQLRYVTIKINHCLSFPADRRRVR